VGSITNSVLLLLRKALQRPTQHNTQQPRTIRVERDGSVWSHRGSERENKGRVCLACLCFPTLHNREAEPSVWCDF